MDQQTHTEHISHALAAYHTYRQQPPSERHFATYIDIVDSLFPPLSSSHFADDLLLVTLLMTDPNMLGCGHTHGEAQELLPAPYHSDSKETHMTPAGVTQHVSPTFATYAQATHAAFGMNHVPMAEQRK
ncbi:hypothetical protein FRC11_011169 [Ceratobasidium sp. 423]|nr:hypothetical protein FRC11_011169 [Ceratobasidium sp. 423]